MARNVIGVIVGIAAAGFIIWSIQQINARLYPLPEGLTLEDHQGMIAYIQTLPVGAFLIVLLSYLIGTAVGTGIAMKIASSHFLHVALIVAGFLLIMSIINLVRIPHPIWFTLINLSIYIPTALLIHRILAPKNQL